MPPKKDPKQKSVRTPATPVKSNTKNKDSGPVSFKFSPIKCKKCNQACLDAENFVTADDDSIICDTCNMWFHKPCTDTNSAEWEALKGSNENITFRCDDCTKNKGQNTFQFDAIRQLLEKNNEMLLSRIEGLESKILKSVDQKIESKMREFEERNDKVTDQKIKTQIEATNQNKKEQINIESTVKSEVTEQLNEMKEIELKKCNLMMFNLKESLKSDASEAEIEDLQAVKQVLEHVSPELKENVISNITSENIKRLGKKPENSNEENTKVRPIKITLQDETVKFKFLKKSHKLKTFLPNQRIGLKKDLTKQQLIEENELRKELQRRKELKEDVMIYRNKVILRADHERMKKETQLKVPESQTNPKQI